MPNRTPPPIVRPAGPQDVNRITTLCEQLGYPLAEKLVRERLKALIGDKTRQMFVAEIDDTFVVGWVEIDLRPLLITGPAAEIGGLVVDEAYRGSGIGSLLMRQAEQWARENGCLLVYLRSNAIRENAHRFYESIGYGNIKTSYTFRKEL
jgi:GNAT superfamily N-acetyltransferase